MSAQARPILTLLSGNLLGTVVGGAFFLAASWRFGLDDMGRYAVAISAQWVAFGLIGPGMATTTLRFAGDRFATGDRPGAAGVVAGSALTVSVTGFSGAHMIRSGSTAAGLMVAGIALVMIGLVACLRTITALRWVSQDLRDDLIETARVVIARRNAQQRAVSIAAVWVAAGLACYLGAVSVAALVADNFAPR
jgi:hypothetical protein